MFTPMKRWVVGSSLQTRRVLAGSILLAVLACAALPGVSEASRKFRGYGFATIVPTKWKTGSIKNGATRGYSASSTQTKPNVTVNSMFMTVNVLPVKDFERQTGRKLPSSLQEVLGAVMVPPQQAQNVQLTAPFRSTTLGGQPAASGAAQFGLNNATVLQSVTVALHRGQIYIVQFYVDMALQYQGLANLQRIHRHWRWR
jgi:hypothetical protein